MIFEFDDPEHPSVHPPGYADGIEATKMFITKLREENQEAVSTILGDPQRLRSYFRQLYSLTGRESGPDAREAELRDAVLATDFEGVAARYRLINQDVVNVLVPYERAVYEDLLNQSMSDRAMSPRAVRRWQAMATPHSVSVYRSALKKQASSLLPISFGQPDDSLSTERVDWWYLKDESSYTDRFGLRFQDDQTWVV